ncbi:uncharacterized protein LOC105914383 [Setaria italica]|uniref:uncharacterized protein LOC105914383 n=1 Tax=Setaria italica TaxID=4555 RepID=UPI000645C671|nr:uncharacterized protein LOC105914383 [Setaria italica]
MAHNPSSSSSSTSVVHHDINPFHVATPMPVAASTVQLINIRSHQVVYAFQDFHNLHQGDLSVGDYCCRLKRLADNLTNVGHPITDQDLVVNTMHGLSSKFNNALGVIGAMNPIPSFLWVHSYLLQEERRMDRTHEMEDANALLATGSNSSSTATAFVAMGSSTEVPFKPPSSTTTTPPAFSLTKGGNDLKKRHKQSDGKNRSNASPTLPNLTAPPQANWGSVYNPWTGVVQAWPMPPANWRGPNTGILGNRPGAPSHAMMVSTPGQTQQISFGALANLFIELHGQLLSTATYNGSGDWFLDTGASTHMATHPSFPRASPYLLIQLM